MRKFEMKVIAAGPGSIEEAVLEALKDGTWEIKGSVSSQTINIGKEGGTSSPMIRVFLQRQVEEAEWYEREERVGELVLIERRNTPFPQDITVEIKPTAAQLEDAGQETLFCACKPPAGVIGSPNCKICGKPIKDKAK